MNKAWIREHFNGNDPSMIMWPFFAAQPSPEHDQLKLYLVVHQRSSQHDAGEYKCIIIKPGIKYAAHDAACKKEKYNGEPQADGGKQLLPLLRRRHFLIEYGDVFNVFGMVARQLLKRPVNQLLKLLVRYLKHYYTLYRIKPLVPKLEIPGQLIGVFVLAEEAHAVKNGFR